MNHDEYAYNVGRGPVERMVGVDGQHRAALRRVDDHALVGDGLDRRFEPFALLGCHGFGRLRTDQHADDGTGQHERNGI